jgi:hypothetical protein
MNVLEMKVEIYETLAQTHDEEKVTRLYEALHQIIEDDTDWWDELTPRQQEQLSKSIEESHNPENWIEFDDFKKKNERWFKG